MAFCECSRFGSSKKRRKTPKREENEMYAMFFCINLNFLLVHINESSSLKINKTGNNSIQYIISIINSFSHKRSFLNFTWTNKGAINWFSFSHAHVSALFYFHFHYENCFFICFSAFFTTLNPIVRHTRRRPTSSDRYFSCKKSIETINNRSGNSERLQDNFTFPIFSFFSPSSSLQVWICHSHVSLVPFSLLPCKKWRKSLQVRLCVSSGKNFKFASCSHLTLAKPAIFFGKSIMKRR